MTWGASIAIGVGTAVVAAICFLLVGAQYQQQHVLDLDDVESLGMVPMMLEFAIAGFVLGIAISRFVTAGPPRAAEYSIGGVLAISAFLWMRLPMDHVPYIGREYLTLNVEIKCPKNWNPDYRVLFAVNSPDFHIPGSDGRVDWNNAKLGSDGSWIVSAACGLLSSREDRIAKTTLDGKTPLRFHVPLPGRPTAANEQWSEWSTKEFVDGTGTGFSVRARVERPSVWKRIHPTQAQSDFAARQAALSALSPADALVR